MKNKIKILGLVGLMVLAGFFGIRYLKEGQTTTPKDFINSYQVSSSTYLRDKEQVIKTIDSLITIKIIHKPAEYGLRYFNGTTYEDTIERKWAINLPMKSIKYVEHYVDTLFYNPDNQNEFAGIIISKTENKLAKNGIEYVGNGFLCKRNTQTLQIRIIKYSVTGSQTLNQCRESVREIYFRELEIINGCYNLNDIRYWSLDSVRKVDWE